VPQITARAERELDHHRVTDRGGGVVVIDINAARGVRRQPPRDIAGLVVDGRIVAEFVDAELHLLRSARDADRTASHQLGDLADRRADRGSGGRDHDRVARARFAQIEQSEIGGDAVEPEHTKRQRERQIAFPHLTHDVAAIRDRVVLPTQHAHHLIALGEAGMARGDHRAGAERAHHLADADRVGVVGDGADPAAHRRLDREILVAY
jgi:hypothetical protein